MLVRRCCLLLEGLTSHYPYILRGWYRPICPYGVGGLWQRCRPVLLRRRGTFCLFNYSDVRYMSLWWTRSVVSFTVDCRLIPAPWRRSSSGSRWRRRPAPLPIRINQACFSARWWMTQHQSWRNVDDDPFCWKLPSLLRSFSLTPPSCRRYSLKYRP